MRAKLPEPTIDSEGFIVGSGTVRERYAARAARNRCWSSLRRIAQSTPTDETPAIVTHLQEKIAQLEAKYGPMVRQ